MSRDLFSPAAGLRNRWLMRGAVLVGIIGLAYIVNWRFGPNSLINGGLVIADSKLDFGEAWATSEFVWHVPLSNGGSSEVKVLDFQSSCNCQKLEPQSVVLRPGEKTDLKITINLTSALPSPNHKVERQFGVQFNPVIAGLPLNQQGWIVTGKVRFAAIPFPTTATFASPLTRGETYPHVTVKVVTDPEVEHLLLEPSDNWSTFLERTATALDEWTLRVCPKHNGPSGLLQSSILLRPVDRHQKQLPPLVIPATALVLERVQSLPEKLLLGRRHTTETASDTIILQSRTKEAFAVESFESTSSDISLEPLEDPAVMGLTKTFRIKVTFARLGPQSINLRFRLKVANQADLVDITTPVAYYGISETKQKR